MSIYERDLLRMNAMDFDDLLFRTVNLLELFEEVRERYRDTFRHVLVDEYQDTNHAQYRLLQLLVGGGRQPQPASAEPGDRPAYAGPVGHRNLAVVGDDAQSIYSFRGADIRNILDFQDDFPDARVVKLEQNYRSTETILAAANAVIANNRGGIAKRLWSELGQGEQIQLRALDDEHAEARFVVGEIERLARRGRLARGDRGPLPHQRDVAGDRGHARAPRDRLPGDRRHEVLRARRDQGRDRLPVAAGQPVRRRQLHARRQLAAARASGRPRSSRVLAHAATHRRLGVGGRGAPERGPRPRRGRGQGAAAASWTRWPSCARWPACPPTDGAGGRGRRRAAAARGAGRESCSRRCSSQTGYVEALEAERTIEAQGRIENLEQLVEVGREFDAAAAERTRTRSTCSCSRSRSSPTPTRAATTRAW